LCFKQSNSNKKRPKITKIYLLKSLNKTLICQKHNPYSLTSIQKKQKKIQTFPNSNSKNTLPKIHKNTFPPKQTSCITPKEQKLQETATKSVTRASDRESPTRRDGIHQAAKFTLNLFVAKNSVCI
jgi:hypothetical protein